MTKLVTIKIVMIYHTNLLLLFIGFLFFANQSFGQDSSGTFETIHKKVIKSTSYKVETIEKKITNRARKRLELLLKTEQKLKNKLNSSDSNFLQELFPEDLFAKYNLLIEKFSSTNNATGNSLMRGAYLPFVDSTHQVMAFLASQNEMLNGVVSKNVQQQAGDVLKKIKIIESKFNSADQVEQFIKQRTAQLRQVFLSRGKTSLATLKAFNSYAKQVQYYSQQVKELKEQLNEPEKVLSSTLKHLNKIQAFQTFMAKHSFLAQAFPSGDNYQTTTQTVGLQTRMQISETIKNQTGQVMNYEGLVKNQALKVNQSMNTGGIVTLLKKAKGELKTFQVKVNSQKGKNIKDRIEYGFNMQTLQRTNYFPNVLEIGGSMGYKINDQSIAGLGLSYRAGLGTDIEHIRLSHNGIGLRTYIDWKIKGHIFISGGFEYNYQGVFSASDFVKKNMVWGKSGLLGVTSIVPVKSSFFKATKIQLLWDFLSYDQLPRTQPFKFRVGYNF
ncbi:hypothetical protein ESA94_13720 [Lacibacter luteus]|uniref:Uncharacterized protein n=1 Tax=Lacibacter luteus TaxID=2508719 RepID=A0A4V1M7B8_9BACT|nr:hypothetical protein [Lacibacter luteus]RXK59194.1 hypothetical protein ESA94_13720 [Lacibacter luteus]